MKKLLAFLLLGLVLATQPLFAQSGSLVQYNQSRYQIDQQLMLGLGSWASSNFVLSGIGRNQAQTPEERYYHQMNVFWNVVNIGLAVPGYLNGKHWDELYRTWFELELEARQLNLISSKPI